MEYQDLYADGAPAPAPPPSAASARGRVRRVAASTAAATLLLGGGIGIGVALTGGATASTGGSPQHHGGWPSARCESRAARALHNGHPVAARRVLALCRRPLLRLARAGAIHGEVTYKAKSGTRTLAFERGTIRSVAGSVLTVQAVDGTSWSWDIVADTVIRSGRQQIAVSKLAAGDHVLIAGPVASGTKDARMIRVRTAT